MSIAALLSPFSVRLSAKAMLTNEWVRWKVVGVKLNDAEHKINNLLLDLNAINFSC